MDQAALLHVTGRLKPSPGLLTAALEGGIDDLGFWPVQLVAEPLLEVGVPVPFPIGSRGRADLSLFLEALAQTMEGKPEIDPWLVSVAPPSIGYNDAQILTITIVFQGRQHVVLRLRPVLALESDDAVTERFPGSVFRSPPLTNLPGLPLTAGLFRGRCRTAYHEQTKAGRDAGNGFPDGLPRHHSGLRRLLYDQHMRPGQDLSAVEFSHLYHVLDDEVKRARIGTAGRVSFRLLEAASYSLPVLLSLAYFLGSVGPHLVPAMHTLAVEAKARLGGLLLLLIAAIVALFVANLPLFVKAYRQWRLSRRLLALRLLDSAMLPPPRLSFKLLVLLAPLGFLMLFLQTTFKEGVESIPQRIVAVILLVLWPLALFLADGFLRRLRSRLQYFEEIRSLRARLAAAKDSNEGATLSRDLAIRLADVERARRLRGSAEAIDELRSRSQTSFAVSKSDSAVETLRSLGDSERVTIERALLDLAARQEKSTERVKAGPPSTLHVEGTPWQLVYEVDPAMRTLYLLAIRAQRDYE